MRIRPEKIKKILIIQYEPFGDVLLNTGYLPFLRKKFPGARIVFLVRYPYSVVLEGNPDIDELMVFRQERGIGYIFSRLMLFMRIFRRRFDLVLDQMRGTGSAQMTFFSFARYRIGWKNSRLKCFYNVLVPEGEARYSAALKFDLLKPLGIAEQMFKLFYHIKDESLEYIDDWLRDKNLENFVCIAPSSPVAKKKWNPESFAQAIDGIVERLGLPVVLLGGPNEMEDMRKVASFAKHEPHIAPPTDFNQAAAMLKRAKLLLCNDGGMNHLCVTTGTPALAIFGNTKPINWCPSMMGNYRCLFVPNHPRNDENRFGITPEMVVNTIVEMLK